MLHDTLLTGSRSESCELLLASDNGLSLLPCSRGDRQQVSGGELTSRVSSSARVKAKSITLDSL